MIRLIDVPFSFCQTVSLALTTFKPMLLNLGLECEYLPLHLQYAAKVGFASYGEFTDILHTHLANWICSEHISSAPVHSFLQDVSKPPGMLYSMRFQATKFFREISEQEIWKDTKIAGFSIYLHQVSAALSFSKLLKQKHPQTLIVMGGPSMTGDAGIEFIQKCPWIDVVFLGQSDFTFPEFCSRINEGQRTKESLRDIPGVAFRDGEKIITQPGHSSVNLNQLPLPDCEDYLDALEPYKDDPYFEDPRNAPSIWFEFARGCEYGVKKVCKFCSYIDITNGVAKFRTPENALQLLRDLHAKYFPRIKIFGLADPLLPKQMISTVFEPWSQERKSLGLKEDDMIFWAETKPWLTRNEVRILKEAGVQWLHAGIEHLHPEALKGMAKGQTRVACIAHLKWAFIAGLNCEWHYMLEIPVQENTWNTDNWDLIPN